MLGETLSFKKLSSLDKELSSLDSVCFVILSAESPILGCLDLGRVGLTGRRIENEPNDRKASLCCLDYDTITMGSRP